eukprot:974481-Pyramimonas_sp.AAC.1
MKNADEIICLSIIKVNRLVSEAWVALAMNHPHVDEGLLEPLATQQLKSLFPSAVHVNKLLGIRTHYTIELLQNVTCGSGKLCAKDYSKACGYCQKH